MILYDFLKMVNINEDLFVEFYIDEVEYELKKLDGDYINGKQVYNKVYIASDYAYDDDNDDINQLYATIITDKKLYTEEEFLGLEIHNIDIRKGWVTLNLFE